jgi:flagellar hook-basal body complex protein FliE
MIDGISALTASGASGVTTASLGAPAAAAPSPDASAGASFSQVMSQVSGDVVGNLKAAEAASIQGLQGAAPVHKVVEAIMSAQRSLQSSLALRDKAVAAYQEISRMAI